MSTGVGFHIVVAFVLAVLFVHFAGAGARTFKYNERFDEGGPQANVLFQLTVAIVLILAVYYRIELLNGIGALILGACSLALYEWCRRTVQGYGLSVIRSETLPESLVQSGPYAYVRHPFYLSYLLASVALLVAVPVIWSAIHCAVYLFFFARGAWIEERNLMQGPLAAAYAEYKGRTGTLLLLPARSRR